MQEKNKYENDERIEKIYALLIKYTTGDFSTRETVSDKADELDAIIVGLNTLGEEVQTSGKALKEFEKRINAIMEVLLQYIRMDFSTVIEISNAGDELDAIAVGLNTLAEELKAAKELEEKNIKKLKEKNELISNLNIELENNIIQLETSNKELEAFTYSVSHDLRAPLRAIHNYTKILSEDYLANIDEQGKEMMERVMSNSKKMGQLIDDLLAFSKVGKKELVFTQVNMNQLTENVLKDLKNSLPVFATKITIKPLNPLKGDYNLISLVLTNLLSNAIKYSSVKQNAEIEIGVENENSNSVYYVKDNGVGFDMKYYDKLFGVFQRLHADNEFEGTGVGLALVKRIINRHGGKVWATSKLNEGATFYFTLSIN